MKDKVYVIKYKAAAPWITDLFWVFSVAFGLLLTFACYISLQEYWLISLAVLPVFMILAGLVQQNRIVMRSSGIRFPVHLAPSLLGRTKRKWSDIGAVMIIDRTGPDYFGESDYDSKDLVIHFNSGGHVKLQMSAVSMPDLDKFFRASKGWGSTAVFAPELIELKRKLFNTANTQTKQIAFTTMWEEQMQQHFTTTNFVPLDRGQTLQNGNFKIMSQLTAGGLSAIYLAERPDRRTVVIKEAVVPTNADETIRQKAKELFDREAKLLSTLQHPRIARVFDHFVEQGRDYMVLEFIAGQSLRQLVTRLGAQPEDTVLDWAIEIAGILEYLHTQQPPVVHRDVSPDNLLLRDDGAIYMIDFGAANEFVGTATGTLIGKQAYIAPEQFRGKAEPASDIYALGGTLFFLLTGQEPEALSVSHPKEVRSIVSTEADDLVARCTAIDPLQRPLSAEALRQLIEKVKELPRGGIIKLSGNKG